jgi:arabinogalactan oligomer/maltooligosaccharide transport system permease protein
MATTTLGSRKRAPGRTKANQQNIAYMYLIPAFAVMAVIAFYPLVYQAIVSFTDFATKDLRGGLQSENLKFIGLQNYVDIATGGLPVQNFEFFRVLAFDFWWALSNVALHVPAGVLIAVLLNTQGLWFKKFYRAIFILPIVFPSIVVATVWRNIFDSQYGAVNQLLTSVTQFFGAVDPVRLRWLEEYAQPIPFLFPGVPLVWAYYAMLIANFWLGWPFMCLVATGALQSIPKELYEAADIDGASGSQSFWNITVPLLRPAIVPAAVLGFNTTFNLFGLVFWMTGGGPARATELLVTFAYDLTKNLRLFGAAAAFSVIVFFVSMTIFLITNRITRATESYDA